MNCSFQFCPPPRFGVCFSCVFFKMLNAAGELLELGQLILVVHVGGSLILRPQSWHWGDNQVEGSLVPGRLQSISWDRTSFLKFWSLLKYQLKSLVLCGVLSSKTSSYLNIWRFSDTLLAHKKKTDLETSVLLSYKFEYLRIQEFLVIFTPGCISQRNRSTCLAGDKRKDVCSMVHDSNRSATLEMNKRIKMNCGISIQWGFPGGVVVKNLPANARDAGLIPGGRNGNPLQYSCLGNLTDRGTWWATGSMGLQRVGHDWVSTHTYTMQ